MQFPRTALLLTAGFIALSTAQAQSYLSPDPPPHAIEDQFRLEVDAFRGSYDTHLRLDQLVNVGGTDVLVPGTDVSGEEDFGLASNQTLGQVELTLLPAEHHIVRFSALSMRRSGRTLLRQRIAWENDTYLPGELVDSHLDFTMAGLTYGYMLFRKDRYELGLTFGIQISSVSANAEVRSRVIRESETGDAPIPMFGIEGRFDLTRRWSIDARYQRLSLNWVKALAINTRGVEATISDGRAAVRWRQNQHLLYGLGYRFFKLDAISPQTSPAGAVALNLTGPMLFVQASL
jgi:hypothetical protein